VNEEDDPADEAEEYKHMSSTVRTMPSTMRPADRYALRELTPLKSGTFWRDVRRSA
jgi:hypothetical protein